MARREREATIGRNPDRSDGGPSTGRDLALAAATGFAVFLVFLPSASFPFLGWDDDVLLIQNPDFRGLGPRHLAWMFTTTHMGHYHPLTWLSFALNHAIGGLSPRGYHLVNVLLHAVNASLVCLLARVVFERTLPALSSAARMAGAVLAGLLFGLHPMRVESVAWVTERRDVLSTAFLLAAVLSYLRYARDPRGSRGIYAAAFVLALLSLLSKAWGMTLPVVLLVLDVYPLRRVERGPGRARCIALLLAEKLPFALAAVGAAIMAAVAQVSTVGSYATRGFAYRLGQAAYGLVYYPVATVLPIRLSPIHEHPAALEPSMTRYWLPIAVVAALTVGLGVVRRRWPAGLTAWLLYAVIVSPVLGVVQAGPQFVADRYSYVACVPLVMLAVSGVLVAAGGAAASARRIAVWTGVSAACVLALAVGTLSYLRVWSSTERLWQRALDRDPNSWNALCGLASLRLQSGDVATAVDLYRRAHEIVPDFAMVTVNLAWSLGRLGQAEESAALFLRAATQPSVSVNDLLTIGNGLALLGRHGDAQAVFHTMLERAPDDAEGRYRLAESLEKTGQTAAALAEYQRAADLFEPVVRGGLNDPRQFVEAGLFRQACRRIVALGDPAVAQRYREKLALVGG